MSARTQQREDASLTHPEPQPDAPAPFPGHGDAIKCRGCEARFVPSRSWQEFCTKLCRRRYHLTPRAKGPSTAERLAALEARVDELEEAMELVRGHLVL